MSGQCPGINSQDSGTSEACKGCPNASLCSKPKIIDPNIDVIKQKLSSIKIILAVMSGKGGVGKSTYTRNIASNLAKKGLKTIILDLDFSGPTIPKLTGTDGQSMTESNNIIYPVEVNENLFVLSVGYLVDSFDTGMVFNSSSKDRTLKTFLLQCDFTSFDAMVIDTPPNITDEHLGMVNYIKPHCSVIVTTPQKISFQDVIRQLDFCKKAGITILGVVENMKGYLCTECQHEANIFPSFGVEGFCQSKNIPYLGFLRLKHSIAKGSDSGEAVEEDVFENIANVVCEWNTSR